MRKPRRAEHERSGNAEHIDLRERSVRVFTKAEIGVDLIQLFEKRRGIAPLCEVSDETKLRDDITRQSNCDEDRRNGVSKSHHAILRHLRVGNPLHPSEPGVKEDNRSANDDPSWNSDPEELRKDDPHSAHLAHDVGQADENRADDRDQTGCFGIIAITNKVRYGRFSEFSKKGHHQDRQKDKSSRPAHQETRTVVSTTRQRPCHRNKGRRAHPVGRGCHAISKRRNPATSHVVFLRRPRPLLKGDPDVERERCSDKDVVPKILTHFESSSSTLNFASSPFMILV